MPGDGGAVHDGTGGGQQDGVPHQRTHDGVEELLRGVLYRLVLCGLTLGQRLVVGETYIFQRYYYRQMES